MELNEITRWVEQFLEGVEGGYYLVDVSWHKKTQKLEIYIDTDAGITLGECQRLSRKMQESLEDGNLLSEDYVLEVSSPGLERPLRLPRQYEKNTGRVILVELVNGDEEIGRLERIDETGLFLRPEKLGVKGRKTTYGEEKLVLWKDIKQTFVQIRF